MQGMLKCVHARAENAQHVYLEGVEHALLFFTRKKYKLGK